MVSLWHLQGRWKQIDIGGAGNSRKPRAVGWHAPSDNFKI